MSFQIQKLDESDGLDSDSESESEGNPGLVSKIKKATLKSYEEKISLSNLDKALEREMEQKQLEIIFQMLQKQNENLSKTDIQEQLNLYK
jgi:hypothetical protein